MILNSIWVHCLSLNCRYKAPMRCRTTANTNVLSNLRYSFNQHSVCAGSSAFLQWKLVIRSSCPSYSLSATIFWYHSLSSIVLPRKLANRQHFKPVKFFSYFPLFFITPIELVHFVSISHDQSIDHGPTANQHRNHIRRRP